MVTNEQAIESSVVSMRSGWGRCGISAAWLLRCGTKGDRREGAGTRWQAEGKAVELWDTIFSVLKFRFFYCCLSFLFSLSPTPYTSFETGFHCLALAVQELTLKTRVA